MKLLKSYLFIISVSFCAVVLVALHSQRPPVCINSTIVEKVDRISTKGTETVYNCRMNKEAVFSPWFHVNLSSLQQRINKVELGLNAKMSPLKIQIRADQKDLSVLRDDVMAIDEENYVEGNQFERLFTSYWISAFNQSRHPYRKTEVQVLTDFVLYLQGWEIPQDGKWPNVRPLMSSTMIQSFDSLSLRDQLLIRKNIFRIVRGSSVREELDPTDFPGPFIAEKVAVNVIASSLSRGLEKSGIGIKRFLALFASNIQSAGYSQKSTDIYFDALFATDQKYSEKSPGFKKLKSFAEKNPSFRIAIKDKDRIWILPNEEAIPLTNLEGIHAGKVVAEICGSLSFEDIFKYKDATDRLIVTDSCAKNRVYDIASYFKGSIERFATANENVAFIQFHLPSLIQKASLLPQNMNVIRLIQEREKSSQVFQTFGWQEVRWNEDIQAYSPHAISDGIGLFRIN